MPKIYRVQVDPEYRWGVVTVSGRTFTKVEPVEMQEIDLNYEIFDSPLLLVEEVKPPRSKKAKEPEGGR